jgi:hypothetical protein
MIALLLLLALLIAGIFSFAETLPLVMAFPLIFVAVTFAVLVSAELWRRWRLHESARAMMQLRARVVAARRIV